MKAVKIEQLGGPEVMQIVDIPMPEIRPHQMLIRVEAVGLNYSDIMIREGKYLDPTRLPYVLGRECAGVIEQVGAEVSGFTVGQRVFAVLSGGALAEYAVVNPLGAFPLPDGMTPELAVTLIVQGVTALHCLETYGRLAAGETVLIHAAAGGVGTLALQIARARSAEGGAPIQVIGTASSDEKCDLIRGFGAQAVRYDDGHDWVAAVREITGGRGADLILESVGGEVFLRSFREALADWGRLVVFGAASGQVVKLTNVELLASNKIILGYYLGGRYFMHNPQPMMEASLRLLALVLGGQVQPVIGRRFPLDEAVAAFNHMQNRESVGKIVINP